MNIKYVNRYIHAFSLINHRCFANMRHYFMFNMQLNKPCFTCISMMIITGCLLSRGGRSTMAITEYNIRVARYLESEYCTLFLPDIVSLEARTGFGQDIRHGRRESHGCLV